MFARSQAVLLAAVAGLAAPAGEARAQNEFQPPPNSLALDDTGAVEAIQGNYVKFRSSKEEVWLLELRPETTVSIEGEADGSYLRPGLAVELTGSVNEKLTLDDPIEEIEVFSGKGRSSQGLFSPDESDEDAKPLKNPEVGKYRIRGRVRTVKDGTIVVAAGRFMISGKLGEEVKVKINLDDARKAKFGDKMTVKAWYYDITKPNPTLMRPGKALAEEVKITLSDPTDDKGR
jgi:hypothetical protein